MPPQGDRDLELALLRLSWRLDALDRWRDDVTKRLDELDAQVEGLEEADRIAAAVAEAIRHDPPPVGQALTSGLSVWQRWGAFCAGALLLAAAVKGLLPL